MKLKEWMKERRWPATAMASALNITQGHTYAIKNGLRTASDRLAKAIVDLTNGEVTYEELRPAEELPPMCPCCGQRLFKRNQHLVDKVNGEVE